MTHDSSVCVIPPKLPVALSQPGALSVNQSSPITMAEQDSEMEARIKVLENRMLALEERMRRLTESLLGTLDGKPGVLSSMQRALELSERTATNVEALTTQIDGLKLDRAKILGGIAVVATFSGLFVKYLLH